MIVSALVIEAGWIWTIRLRFAELKVKRLSTYDDVVRAHLKTIGTYSTDLTFWRASGKLLEVKVVKTAS
jgi:hypothetical protein